MGPPARVTVSSYNEYTTLVREQAAAVSAAAADSGRTGRRERARARLLTGPLFRHTLLPCSLVRSLVRSFVRLLLLRLPLLSLLLLLLLQAGAKSALRRRQQQCCSVHRTRTSSDNRIRPPDNNRSFSHPVAASRAAILFVAAVCRSLRCRRAGCHSMFGQPILNHQHYHHQHQHHQHRHHQQHLQLQDGQQ